MLLATASRGEKRDAGERKCLCGDSRDSRKGLRRFLGVGTGDSALWGLNRVQTARSNEEEDRKGQHVAAQIRSCPCTSVGGLKFSLATFLLRVI